MGRKWKFDISETRERIIEQNINQQAKAKQQFQKEALRMRKKGMMLKHIAVALGSNTSTISKLTSHDYQEHRGRHKKAP